MITDKKKLREVFSVKFLEMLDEANRERPDPDPGMFSPNMREIRIRWESYLNSLGCRVVYTPNGLLPARHREMVHIQDPGSTKWEFGRNWHIQMSSSLAERILSIGLP